jgi:hypothetical protein
MVKVHQVLTDKAVAVAKVAAVAVVNQMMDADLFVSVSMVPALAVAVAEAAEKADRLVAAVLVAAVHSLYILLEVMELKIMLP